MLITLSLHHSVRIKCMYSTEETGDCYHATQNSPYQKWIELYDLLFVSSFSVYLFTISTENVLMSKLDAFDRDFAHL